MKPLTHAGFLPSIIAITFTFSTLSHAQDVPPRDMLDAILAQLPKKLPAGDVNFRLSAATLTNKSCRMEPAEMTTSLGPDSHTFSVLVDPLENAAIKPKELLARIDQITVDADGAARAYHPEDPYGQGVCKRLKRRNGRPILTGVCALDEFSNAGIRVFSGSQQAVKPDPSNGLSHDAPDLAQEWAKIWPLIRDRTLKPIDLTSIAGADAPGGYYLFYLKERNLSAFFSRYIIPESRDGYPCVHGAESPHPGYFVAATSLSQSGPVRSDGCEPARYIDAEKFRSSYCRDRTSGKSRSAM